VNWLATTKPARRLQRARHGGHARGQQQGRRVGVAAARVGALGVEEVVLQVDDDQRRLRPADLGAFAHDGLTSRLPCASTSAWKPGSSHTVVSACSRIAGPSMRAATGSSSRAWRTASCHSALVEHALRAQRRGAALALGRQHLQVELGPHADARVAQVHHADGDAVEHAAEGGRVRGLEGRADRGGRERRLARIGEHHGQRVRLAGVEHVERDHFLHRVEAHARGIEALLAARGQLVDAALHVGHVELGQRLVQGLHGVMAHVGDHAAQRGGHAGVARHDARGHAHLAHHGAHMQRAAAAEGHVGEAARVVPALDGHEADGTGHARIGNGKNRFGRRVHIEAQRTRHMLLDRLARLLRVQRGEQPAAQWTVGRDAAQQHVGIGHRRAHVAAAVAGRPGHAARDSGPTCSMPLASTEAMEPPPAPMVSIWIIGERITMPNSMAVCAASAASPFATSDTSKDVRPCRP
jgi:hypothetical protein